MEYLKGSLFDQHFGCLGKNPSCGVEPKVAMRTKRISRILDFATGIPSHIRKALIPQVEMVGNGFNEN